MTVREREGRLVELRISAKSYYRLIAIDIPPRGTSAAHVPPDRENFSNSRIPELDWAMVPCPKMNFLRNFSSSHRLSCPRPTIPPVKLWLAYLCHPLPWTLSSFT